MSNITFHDCMPAMADVVGGSRPRPEPLPDTDILTHIKGYIAEDRLAPLGEQPIVLAEKGQDSEWFAPEIAEIREWVSDSPIVHIGGYLVGFNEDATSLTVLQLPTNSKERTNFIKHHAIRLLDESGADIKQQVTLLPLAKQLMAVTGCGIDAAKRRIAQAIRLARGEYAKAKTGGWGGRREGAGRRA